jgi:DNA primase
LSGLINTKGECIMSSTWVDFKELRTRLRFADVLRSHNVELKIKGDRATGFCPLPGHPRHEGKRRTPSFSANLTRGLFNCFGCHAHGNAIDFQCYMSGGDPQNPTQLRDAALHLQERFLILTGEKEQDRSAKLAAPKLADTPVESDGYGKAQQKPDEDSARPVIVNAPLDFTLKMLDAEHHYLKQRGLTSETVSYFGLGYCSRGLMQGRIVIPLHNPTGQLIGYAGRLVNDSLVDEEHPKYRFPGSRERDGVRYEFQKSQFLFNGHRIAAPVDDLIVVEGFMSVFWLVQNGYPNVVAMMGSTCSAEQAALIRNLVTDGGHVWAFTDGDQAGSRCAQDLLVQIATDRSVRWAKLDASSQPTDCSALILRSILPHPIRSDAW